MNRLAKSSDYCSNTAPLLFAIMACGAVYLGESSTSISMHAIAVQLIFEVGERLTGKSIRITQVR